MSRSEPMTVYVSGSSRGLGLSVARGFAEQGASLVLSSRNRTHLEAAREGLLLDFPGCVVDLIVGDLRRVEDQESILDQLEDRDLLPDVFVCNAGQPPDRRFPSLTRDGWQEDLELLLGQAVFASQRFAPIMAQRGFGRILFVSSTFAKEPTEEFITSSIARAGLFALSKALSRQYGRAGVATFVLCLGFVDTPLLRNMALDRPFDAPEPSWKEGQLPAWERQYTEWAEGIPKKRIGDAKELAEVMVFLASEKSDYLTGSVLSFAGGLERSLI